jgi:hypothetical protein
VEEEVVVVCDGGGVEVEKQSWDSCRISLHYCGGFVEE